MLLLPTITPAQPQECQDTRRPTSRRAPAAFPSPRPWSCGPPRVAHRFAVNGYGVMVTEAVIVGHSG